MNDYFKIYNLNFNPIPLPVDDLGYGLRGLDLSVTSTSQEVTEHSIPGLPGNIITGYRDSTRDMNIHVRLKARNATDYQMKLDNVFAFFKRLGTFYVARKQQVNKLMKVRVVDSYEFQRPQNMQEYATADIPLKVDGKPYWISRETTMNLHAIEGYPFNDEWNFGMGLEVDPDKLNYQFENVQGFTVYNAGTVPIKTIQEKDNCIITIEINQNITNFKIYDAGDRYFEYNPMQNASWALKSGDTITLNGHYMTMNNTPIMERTNRFFMKLMPGDNDFTVDGLTQYVISFDFRFKYY